jgi:two-component system sensor histidine kinase RegB
VSNFSLKQWGAGQDETATKIAFTWLLRLRWWAICCQIAVIFAVAYFFPIRISLPLLLIFITFQTCSNLYFQYLRRKRDTIPSWLLGFVMMWDIFHLTLLLFYSGGPMNPFTFLYLIHVALAAVLMQQPWSWGLTILTIVCYAALFVVHDQSFFYSAGRLTVQPVSVDLHGILNEEGMHMHLEGMWVAFSLTSLFIVFFVGRIQQALAFHQQTINRLQREKVKTERLASLATLAAGAAHELSTPLSTIAVASNEMQYLLKEECNPSELTEDLRLIRGQVQHCREILSQLSADAGHHSGEPIERITVSEFFEALVYEFEKESSRKITAKVECPGLKLAIPVETFLRTLRGILKNAAQADPNGIPLLRCYLDLVRRRLVVEISDRGTGMDEQTLQKAAEPFFTTKSGDRGMGLGLFLAQSVAENYGGGLTLNSRVNQGTTVSFYVALSAVEAEKGP